MKTLIISSSLSETSRSFILCKQIQELLEKQGVDTTFVDARELDLLPCHKGMNPSMEELSNK